MFVHMNIFYRVTVFSIEGLPLRQIVKSADGLKFNFVELENIGSR